jgi:hypothetical protein
LSFITFKKEYSKNPCKYFNSKGNLKRKKNKQTFSKNTSNLFKIKKAKTQKIKRLVFIKEFKNFC